MRQLLSPEGPAMQFINKLVSSVYLNILWFICCIPIVTIGASTTALFYVTLKVAKDQEGSLTRAFFHSFRENFKQGTQIWLILLGLGVILGIDGYIFYHLRFDHILWTLGTAVYLVALAAYGIILMYIFPLLARFHNTTKAMFLNSIMIGMRFLLCTALMAAVYFVMAFVILRVFTPAIILGEGLCALLCSYLLSNILAQCEGTKKESENDSLHLEEPKPLSPIWQRFKLPIIAAAVLLVAGTSLLYSSMTRKQPPLYLAWVNVSMSESLTGKLTDDFLLSIGKDPQKDPMTLYPSLYLTDNPSSEVFEYSYASRMKILGAIDGEQLDVVLMNREAFDAFSQNGYLYNLEDFLSGEPELVKRLRPCLISNIEILEDNAADLYFDDSAAYTARTAEYPMGLNLCKSPLLSDSGFDDTVDLGIIANTPRKDLVLSYLKFLFP